ncbi:MAG: MerR family transcriptional regulator [Alphaproteobacteria bacterium]|nr:MerR family transcriptional regulator [Alphaproteobacteria bacterium]
MENNNEYFASINEVSKKLNVPAHTLRYWEKQFPVAIRPTTGAGGRRYYRTETVQKLIQIKDLLYTHGMTIAGVKKLLRDGNLSGNLPDGNVPQSVATPQKIPPTYSADEIDTAITLLENAKNILQ